MTGYHISIGYQSSSDKDDAKQALLEVVDGICKYPMQIVYEARRLGDAVPDEYAESYSKPWADASISIIDKEGDFQVMQLASGGGIERGYKEAMRRAFCRLVLEAMHKKKMEININVS